MEEVERVLRQLALRKENRVAGRAVTEALARIEVALRRHPELSPFGAVPIGEEAEGSGEPALVPPALSDGEGSDEDGGDVDAAAAAILPSGPIPDAPAGPELPEPLVPRPEAMPRIRRLTPNALVRRVRMGESGLTCCIDGFGPDGAESFTEGTIIYVNRDHPLYQHESAKRDTLTRHVARLITQELALMRERDDPRRAFLQQSLLLKESFAEED